VLDLIGPRPPTESSSHTGASDEAITNAFAMFPGLDQMLDFAGDLHHQALRALGNRLVGILHGCLRHHTAYSETTAWAHRQITQAA
jgi:hypothetical protein